MLARIHVNRQTLQKNKKYGTDEPAITVKTYKDNRYARKVHINGPSTVVHSENKPLSCGARVWIEADTKYITIEN